MKMLSNEMKIGETKEVVTEFEGNPGYIIMREFGEFIVACGEDFEYDEIETLLIEMPENDYHKFDGSTPVAIYEVVETSEIDDTQNVLKATIKRVK